MRGFSKTYQIRSILFLILFIGNGAISFAINDKEKEVNNCIEVSDDSENPSEQDGQHTAFSNIQDELLPLVAKITPEKYAVLLSEIVFTSYQHSGTICSKTTLAYRYLEKVFHSCIKVNAP